MVPVEEVPLIHSRISQSDLDHCSGPHCKWLSKLILVQMVVTFQNGDVSEMWWRSVTGHKKGTFQRHHHAENC